MREYWKERLSPNAARMYGTIVAGVKRRESRIMCGEGEPDDLQAAAYAVLDDHPELYYFGKKLGIGATQSAFSLFGGGGKNMMLMADYIYSEQEIRLCESKINEAKQELRKSINARTTDEEKVVLVAEYIVTNTTYEIDNKYNQNAASSLCYGRAQCSGISAACKLLLDWLGVECIIVGGDADDGSGVLGPHAWNIVRIGREYYHIDVTFMLGCNKSKPTPLKKIFLFYDDDKISSDHRWDRARTPKCTDKSKAIEERTVVYVDSSGKPVQNQNQGATVNRPVVNKPVTNKPIENKPVTSKPIVNKPIVNKPIVNKPVNNSANEERPRTTNARTHQNALEFKSLSALKIELSKILKARGKGISFYLNINDLTQMEAKKMAMNACTMVVGREGIGCSISVSVHPDLYIEVGFEY